MIFHAVPESREFREDLVIHGGDDVLGVSEVRQAFVPRLGDAEVVGGGERDDLPPALLVGERFKRFKRRVVGVRSDGNRGRFRGQPRGRLVRGRLRSRRRVRSLRLLKRGVCGFGLSRGGGGVRLRLPDARSRGGRLDDRRGLGRVGILERHLARGPVAGPPPVADFPAHAERGSAGAGAAAGGDRRRRAQEDLRVDGRGGKVSAGCRDERVRPLGRGSRRRTGDAPGRPPRRVSPGACRRVDPATANPHRGRAEAPPPRRPSCLASRVVNPSARPRPVDGKRRAFGDSCNPRVSDRF